MSGPERSEVEAHYQGWRCVGVSLRNCWIDRLPPWMNENNERARTARATHAPTWIRQRIRRFHGHWVLLEKEVPTTQPDHALLEAQS